MKAILLDMGNASPVLHWIQGKAKKVQLNVGRAGRMVRSRMAQIQSERGSMMRRVWIALLGIVAVCGLGAQLKAQGAPPQGKADQPYVVEYYYKVQWGHQQEFLDLFLKNHYPLLRKMEMTGRILSVKIESPAYHTTEDGRWDYRVTIRFKNSTVATTANTDEEAMIQALWPDQATYRHEEQKRFEILLAHWDLPVTDITPQ
jgi:hypothetical protein